MARLLQLEHDARNAQSAARDAAAAAANAQKMLHNYIEREDIERTEAELPRLIEQAEVASNYYSSLTQTVERCRRWLDNLPDNATLEIYKPQVTQGDPASALGRTREQLSAAIKERDALAKIPVPSDDIEERVRDLVAELAQRARPYVRGIARGGKLSVRWPPKPTSTIAETMYWPQDDCNALLMTALLHPDQLAEVILAEINREANETLPIKEREIRVAQLTDEIEELQRQASDLTYALVQAGGSHTYGQASAEAVLGVVVAQERAAA